MIKTCNRTFTFLLLFVMLTSALLPTCIANAQPTDGWWKNGNNWYYFKKGQAVSGWQTIDGVKYYFDTYTDVMYSERWLNDTHYFVTSGAMARGWAKTKSGIWYYFRTDTGKLYTWSKDRIHPDCLYFLSDGKYHNMRKSGAWVSECTKSGHSIWAILDGPIH